MPCSCVRTPRRAAAADVSRRDVVADVAAKGDMSVDDVGDDHVGADDVGADAGTPANTRVEKRA